MTINFYSITQNFSLLTNTLLKPLSVLQKKIGWVALIALSSLAACYLFYRHYFRDKRSNNQEKKNIPQQIVIPEKIVPEKNEKALEKALRVTERVRSRFNHNKGKHQKAKIKLPMALEQEKKSGEELIKGEFNPQDPFCSGINPSKLKALESYKMNPIQCSKMHKTIIFQDIQFIEFSHDKPKNQDKILLNLMRYLSGLNEINLSHPLCAQVVVDTLIVCKKEISQQLIDWIIHEKTFNIQLLMKCFQIFIDKDKQQLPFDLYPLEQLIKIYINRFSNQQEQGQLLLPSNHPLVTSIMAILIREEPNDPRLDGLVEWMMNQKDYDLMTFSTWILIFSEKERAKATGFPLYYPVRDKMITHFQTKWKGKEVDALPNEVVNYLQSH